MVDKEIYTDLSNSKTKDSDKQFIRICDLLGSNDFIPDLDIFECKSI